MSERNSLVCFTIENNPCLELKVNVLAKPTKYGMHQNNATYVSNEKNKCPTQVVINLQFTVSCTRGKGKRFRVRMEGRIEKT